MELWLDHMCLFAGLPVVQQPGHHAACADDDPATAQDAVGD